MITFVVMGEPKPQGSKTRTRFGMREANKGTKPWREHVAWTAFEHKPPELWDCAVGVGCEFVLPRPGRVGKKAVDVLAHTGYDLDKMCRAVFDAITGVIFVNDSRVSCVMASKRYADPDETPKATIRVWKLERGSVKWEH